MRQFRSIRAEMNAVGELKTPDVRIFGWFLKRDCFVAVFGNWTDVVKDHDLYRGYRIAIRRPRRELGIERSLINRRFAGGTRRLLGSGETADRADVHG
jgi:hypothetical protein